MKTFQYVLGVVLFLFGLQGAVRLVFTLFNGSKDYWLIGFLTTNWWLAMVIAIVAMGIGGWLVDRTKKYVEK